ncbi:MAG TPA: hypothetical protein VEQ41_00780 [Solirubrobacterales bacterium]|nr:hypothetical protein [Solirubrobacterales bacterium]
MQDSALPRKEYSVSSPRPKAFMVENAQWDRIRKRVAVMEDQPSINWLPGAASTAFSVGVSAFLAVLVIPRSEGTQLADWIQPALWAVTAVGFVLAAALFALYRWGRRMRVMTGRDICEEMDTIHAAWQERRD